MIKITGNLIQDVAGKTKETARKRSNYNFHTAYEDPINRMINAVEPEAYFPPHKHEGPDKREIFLILSGKVIFIEFEDTGRIKDHIILDPLAGNFGVEISAGTWHSLIPLESSVLYEIKDGPYDSDSDKVFAGWAPKENEQGVKEFVDKILKEMGL
ncbi:MAG: WbuC family cupin fold metalloprotein [Candidatus Omnitrophota bacterium]